MAKTCPSAPRIFKDVRPCLSGAGPKNTILAPAKTARLLGSGSASLGGRKRVKVCLNPETSFSGRFKRAILKKLEEVNKKYFFCSTRTNNLIKNLSYYLHLVRSRTEKCHSGSGSSKNSPAPAPHPWVAGRGLKFFLILKLHFRSCNGVAGR